ncbi:MAG: gamma-glutamylcyclotransferase family protein [Paracoccaceae bacterium]
MPISKLRKKDQNLAFYFGYGSNMSKKVMENVRNIHPKQSQSTILKNYKIIMNMPGPNFVEPGFANIIPSKGDRVEGVLHEISDLELDRIIASEGTDYELIKVKIRFFNSQIIAKTLIYKTDINYDLPTSKRYKKILVRAARDNELSPSYITELKNKKSVYYPVYQNFLRYESIYGLKVVQDDNCSTLPCSFYIMNTD